MEDTIVQPNEEQLNDFSGDSVVRRETFTWSIDKVEIKASKPKDNGSSGHYFEYTLVSPDAPWLENGVKIRYFRDYTWREGGSPVTPTAKQTQWLDQQRGKNRRIIAAAIPESDGKLGSDEQVLVGRQLIGTTMPDDQDYLTVGSFKPVQ